KEHRQKTDTSKEADAATKEADRKKQIELDKIRQQEIAPIATASSSLRDNTRFSKSLYGMEPPRTGLRPFGINGNRERDIQYNSRQRNFTGEFKFAHRFTTITSDDFGALAYFNTKDVMKVTETMAQPNHGGADGVKMVEENILDARRNVHTAFQILKIISGMTRWSIPSATA
ncbi:MAG: hypothetical protein IJM08_02785, partial [Firmicutes bacterium]|nr:hypothetical protein [Bacillota bacterium]